jgi:uncharacterized protein
MLTKEEIIKKIEDNKEKIKELGAIKIILIGSYAKDIANQNSDIDFLVEFTKGRGLFDDFIGLHHLLEDLFNKKIDIGQPSLIREEIKESILEGKQIEARI